MNKHYHDKVKQKPWELFCLLNARMGLASKVGSVTVMVLCVGFLLGCPFLEEAVFFSVGPPVQLGYQWGKPG